MFQKNGKKNAAKIKILLNLQATALKPRIFALWIR